MLITHQSASETIYLNLDRVPKRENASFPEVYTVFEGFTNKGRVQWSAKREVWVIRVNDTKPEETYDDICRAALAVRRMYRPSQEPVKQAARVAFVNKKAVRR